MSMSQSRNRDVDASRIQSEENILKALNEANKVLVVGYSPTGGGHTARTFSIIDQACNDHHIGKGDTVIFTCPPAWGSSQNRELDNIVSRLSNRNINVILTASDKTVYGYLNPEGSSNDPQIIANFAKYPKRELTPHHDIIKAGLLWTNVSNQTNQKPIDIVIDSVSRHKITLSSKNLMQSLTKHVANDKIFVLTDMDPYLQKAAIQSGIPKEHCLDQQNHAILFGTNPKRNEVLKYNNAYLAKVLCGYGGSVSHIGLGEKNSLQSAVSSAQILGVSDDPALITKKEVRNNFIQLLHEKGNKISLNEPYHKNKPGVFWPNDLNKEDVQQVVYVYAHNYTPTIGEHIRVKMLNKDPEYQNTVFLFCGANAIQSEPGKSYNAMHLAYVAGADGITTAGAGTNGEFAYLHKNADDTSHLLVIPIANHNEQEKNAESLKDQFGKLVLVSNANDIGNKIDELVQQKSAVCDETMKKFMDAILNSETYAKQASDLLFTLNQQNKDAFNHIKDLEIQMQKDPILRANRRYIKSVFQVMEHIKEKLNHQQDIFPITIQLQQKEQAIELKDMQSIVDFFNIENLRNILVHATQGASPEIDEHTENEFLLHNHVYSLFHHCNDFKRVPTMTEISEVEEKIGNKLTTGF